MGVTPEEETAESAAALDQMAESLVALWSLAHNAADVPVPATQLRVLFILERGPVNVSNLAAELDALVSSASRLCDRLEAAGLLLRDHGQDRRQVSVRLSGDGQALLDRLRVRRRDDLGRVLEGMSSPAREALIWGLSQFRDAAQAESDAKTETGPDSAGDPFSLPA
ncbi:MarR family transcriptional regulator [Spirillospora sp. NPDC047279]|uniref:MarR family winged helix-turn-helix transcriptional regulator n=1 Tax=Spirillospora sp. NPDC047279 TaxID=3155478 RepID=UPI0033DF3B3E